MTVQEQAVLRTISALALLGAPPTLAELYQHFDQGLDAIKDISLSSSAIEVTLRSLCERQILKLVRGRYLLSDLGADLESKLTGEEWMPRKLRKARKVASWLARLAGVRAVFLCNRTAFGLPHDEGDLDFFVIVRHGSIWQTRGFAGLPFVLLRDRPKAGTKERDVVCLSFFLSDQALDLAPCLLKPDDVYFRHWFLGLLPLVDDGVMQELWEANQKLHARHPFAKTWLVSPDLRVSVPHLRIPVSGWLERFGRLLQTKYFPRALRERANQDTRVMISDRHLKFHIDDGREVVQKRYQELCERYGIVA